MIDVLQLAVVEQPQRCTRCHSGVNYLQQSNTIPSFARFRRTMSLAVYCRYRKLHADCRIVCGSRKRAPNLPCDIYTKQVDIRCRQSFANEMFVRSFAVWTSTSMHCRRRCERLFVCVPLPMKCRVRCFSLDRTIADEDRARIISLGLY